MCSGLYFGQRRGRRRPASTLPPGPERKAQLKAARKLRKYEFNMRIQNLYKTLAAKVTEITHDCDKSEEAVWQRLALGGGELAKERPASAWHGWLSEATLRINAGTLHYLYRRRLI